MINSKTWIAAANTRLNVLRNACGRLIERVRPRTRLVTLSADSAGLVAHTATGASVRCELADAADDRWTVRVSVQTCRDLIRMLADQSGRVTIARTRGGVRVSGPDGWIDLREVERAENRLHAAMAYARQHGIQWADVRAVAAERREASDACQLDAMRQEVAAWLGIRGAWRSGLARFGQRLDESGRDWSDVPHGDEITGFASEYPILAGLSAGECFDLVLAESEPVRPIDWFEEAIGWIESHGTTDAEAYSDPL